ncbi:hypothetical protein MRS44_014084 [Fusarium solani]|uniref:uncharacterized protein n=1 Tax=Fusarium solani TaxID=169388 RepID=UPI0032C4730E|nr:hypothetical protein MRS44_014084 [Fusarium solani]
MDDPLSGRHFRFGIKGAESECARDLLGGQWPSRARDPAGLAALILHCVRLGAIHTEREALRGVRSPTAVSDADIESLKKHHNMHGVLRAIGLDEGQQRFIEVWRRFDGPAQELKSPGINSSGEALDIVAKLARDLVSGIAGGSS